MSKRIPGWLRQRRVAVAYGVVWGLLVVAIAFFFCATFQIVRVQVPDEYSWTVWLYVITPFLLLIATMVLMQIISPRRSCPILTIRLILIAACWGVFLLVLILPNVDGYTLYRGQGVLDSEIVSFYEAYFIYGLFTVGSLFQCVMIEHEDKVSKVNKVIGGVLAITGILVPKLLESWSLLTVRFYENSCGKCCRVDLLAGILLLQMGVAYAVGLAVMAAIGLFAESIVRFIRSKVSAMSKGSSPADSQNAEVSVPASGAAIASDKQNKESEELPASSSVATRVSQESADGAVVPAQATERLASACGLGVAVPKQLMSAAVSGLVAGVCFSVASRLFGRR
ncbi:hypothetical protein [Actinomyces sp.]